MIPSSLSSSMILSEFVRDAKDGVDVDVRVGGPEVDEDTGAARHVADGVGEVAQKLAYPAGLCR